MSEVLRQRVQDVLDDGWRHADAARAAASEGRWHDFLEEVSEKPGWWAFFERRRCLLKAAQMFSGPVETTLSLLPIWIGNNEDEEAQANWFAGHAQLVHDEQETPGHPDPLIVGSANPFENAAVLLQQTVVCRVRMWTVGLVLPSRSFAPSVPLALRDKDLSVLRAEVIQVLDAQGTPRPAVPRPRLPVPPFSTWVEPRVQGLEESVVSALRALSVTTDGEGNLVQRQSFVET